MKRTKKTIGSQKVLFFGPSNGNGKRRERAASDYQMQSLCRVTYPRKPTIALAMEESAFRTSLSDALRKSGCEVKRFNDGLAMLDYFGDIMLLGPQELIPDLVIADANLNGKKGIDLLVDLRYVGWPTPFILTVEKNNEKLATQARGLQRVLGDFIVLEGEFDIDDMLSSVTYLLDRPWNRPNDPSIPAASSA